MASASSPSWILGAVPAARLGTIMEQQLGILVLMVDAPAGISGAACCEDRCRPCVPSVRMASDESLPGDRGRDERVRR